MERMTGSYVSRASMWISKLIVGHGAGQTVLGPRLAVVHELFGGNWRKEQSDCPVRHPLGGSATERGGLEDPPSVRTVGSANCRAPKLHGKPRDKLLDQASSVAAWCAFESKRNLNGLKKLFYLGLWKTNDQSSEARQ
jgi:hypothetical protein